MRKTVLLRARIEPEQAEKLAKLADVSRRSQGDVIRLLIDAASLRPQPQPTVDSIHQLLETA
ncbi:MAG: hypothetical protein HY326_08090 [Chloroflexi bacterium]|nr:hypothetical protein [Chloroflexota bacterium]